MKGWHSAAKIQNPNKAAWDPAELGKVVKAKLAEDVASRAEDERQAACSQLRGQASRTHRLKVIAPEGGQPVKVHQDASVHVGSLDAGPEQKGSTRLLGGRGDSRAQRRARPWLPSE